MENKKINIAELLKDCPKGMELDCAMWNNVVFDHVDMKSNYPIFIKKMGGEMEFLTEDGCFNFDLGAKCVIFPKNKTTWEGFVPPCGFKDGDIITMKNDCGAHVFIYNKTINEYGGYGYHVIITSLGNFKLKGFCSGDTYHLATEEEKAKLFDAIKDNGYKWNAETKSLEKLVEPKFKVGDRIKAKDDYKKYITDGHVSTITSIKDGKYWSGIFAIEYINEQDKWELDKFNITTLKPFESKVLVRDNVDEIWFPCFFGGLSNNSDYPYRIVGGESWKCCIPYEGNEHLLNKRDDCDEYYKNW